MLSCGYMIWLLPLPLPPSPGIRLSLFLSQCGGGGWGGGRGTKSYDRDKAWSSVTHSILPKPNPRCYLFSTAGFFYFTTCTAVTIRKGKKNFLLNYWQRIFQKNFVSRHYLFFQKNNWKIIKWRILGLFQIRRNLLCQTQFLYIVQKCPCFQCIRMFFTSYVVKNFRLISSKSKQNPRKHNRKMLLIVSYKDRTRQDHATSMSIKAEC